MLTPQTHSKLKKTCPYRVPWVRNNCHHKANLKHICKAKNCPLLDSNRVYRSKPRKAIVGLPMASEAILQPLQTPLKQYNPVLIKTDKGLVPLKDWVPLNQGWHGNLGKRRHK